MALNTPLTLIDVAPANVTFPVAELNDPLPDPTATDEGIIETIGDCAERPLVGTTVQASEPVRINCADWYCDNICAVLVTVTPDPPANVTTPAPKFV